MESKESNIQQSNIKSLNKILTINNFNVQKENSNILTVNTQFKTIYMYIPNKIK